MKIIIYAPGTDYLEDLVTRLSAIEQNTPNLTIELIVGEKA